MNRAKADYFDSQVNSDWASKEYDEDELGKIDHVLQLVGWTPHMRILEPGCGAGRFTQLLIERLDPPGYIVAADISPGMVQACLKRLLGRPNVTVKCAAVEELDLEDGWFDLVLCHQVFPHFDDKERALNKLAACLKHKGKLVVFHFINSEQINDLHRKTDPSVLNDSMPSPDTMRTMFQASGFTIDRLEDDDRGYLLIATRF